MFSAAVSYICARSPDRLKGIALLVVFSTLAFYHSHASRTHSLSSVFSSSSVLTMRTSTFLLAAASLFDLSIAGYALEDDYMTDFYGGFEFFTDPDPTNGNIPIHSNRPLC